MNLAEIPLFSMLRGRLGYLNQRQNVISQNVANTDTPKFVPEDLKPFGFDGRKDAQKGVTMIASTQAGHMAPKNQPRGLSSQYKTVRSPDSEVTINGNAVVLEEEMMKMSDARMNYDAAIGFYQKSLTLLRMAARPPSRG
jgi:flagellar basal-body rod protein FlgB